MSSVFGRVFRVSTWGESHGAGVGCVLDGCPPGLPISEDEVQVALDRRRPGQSRLVTPRDEADHVRFLSGVYEGRTTGTPISMLVFNKDADSSKYRELEEKFRPSHAD
ncbi:MAG: chorismate synthase, partial [Myxococcales bacterium]|nr:chorismate synthase [Myxococcales bacterium]